MTAPIKEPEPDRADSRGPATKQAPYCWQSRIALERIQAKFGTDAINGFGVYLALTRLSSERQNSSKITAPITVIAGLAGLRYRKTQDTLAALADAKVISIHNPNPTGKRPNAPCTYSILSFRRSARNAEQATHKMPTEVCTGSASSDAVSLKGNSLLRRENFREKTDETEKASPSALPAPDGGQLSDASAVHAPW